ncbi:MAG: helix-turn-helix domain-containing protein [Pseudomonadota bacterium]
MAEDHLLSFGRLVRAQRKAQNLSQEALAAAAFGNPDRKSYISAIENARRPNLTAATVKKIAEALSLRPEQIPTALRLLTTDGTRGGNIIEPPLSSGADRIDEAVVARIFNKRIQKEIHPYLAYRYQRRLSAGLKRLKHFTGAPFSMRSFCVSLSLCFVYVSLTGLIGFSFGSPGIGASEPFGIPSWGQAVPPLVLAGASLFFLISGALVCTLILFRASERSIASKVFRLLVGGTVAGLACEAAARCGPDPLSIALIMAIACFGALSNWRPREAAPAGLLGGVLAGAIAAIFDQSAPFVGLQEGILIGAAIGTAAGGTAAFIGNRAPSWSAAMLCGAGAGVGIGAIAVGGLLLLSGGKVAIDGRMAGLIASMWIVLPIINAITDYISLGISHSLGRVILSKAPSLRRSLGVIILDLVVAILLMAMTIAFIVSALKLAAQTTALDLSPDGLINAALVDPWGAGLWLTLMVMTTLFWTYMHFACVAAPAISSALVKQFVEQPLDQRLTAQLNDGIIDINAAAALRRRPFIFAISWGTLAAAPLVLLVSGSDWLIHVFKLALAV